MAGFLYFVPGAQAPLAAETVLREGGAAHAVAGVATKVQAQGPAGSGLLLAPGADVPTYREDSQEWRAAPGGKWWLGFEKAAPPGPEDLARETLLPGYWVELADGRKWLVPVARRYDPQWGWRCALARKRELGADGKWRMGPVAKHARLWDYAEKLQAFFEKRPGAELDGQEEANRTVEVLAANYRVGAIEVSALGLLSDDAIAAVAKALLDWPGLEDLRKNLEAPGEACTSPGAEGS